MQVNHKAVTMDEGGASFQIVVAACFHKVMPIQC